MSDQQELSPPDPPEPAKPPPGLEIVRTGKVDFRMAVTPQIEAEDKVKKAFATAINNHQRLKKSLTYLQQLSHFCEKIAGDVILPAAQLYGEALATQAHQLDAWLQTPPHRLTPRRRELLRARLLDSLNQAINEFNRRELEPILNKNLPPRDGEDDSDEADLVASLLEVFLGVPIDPNDFKREATAEQRQQFDEKYGTAFAEAEARLKGSRPRAAGPKSKKALKAEAAKQAAQNLLDQDLKRIFKNLVLQLHPDRELDETRRFEKEELMKVLIRARDDGDYSELLRLHVLVNESSSHSTTTGDALFSESTLKTLTKMLKEKSKELEMECYTVQANQPLLRQLAVLTEKENFDKERLRRRANHEADRFRQGAKDIEIELDVFLTEARLFYRFLESRC